MLWALARQSSDADAVLRLHPEVIPAAPDPLPRPDRVCWDELSALEQDVDGLLVSIASPTEHPAAYTMRRRLVNIARTWVEDARQLPPVWRALARAGSDDVRAILRTFGLEALVLAAAGRSGKDLVRWLGPLGTRVAQDTADRLISLTPSVLPPEALPKVEAWILESRRTKDRADELIGRLGMASLWAGEPAPARATFHRLARSNIAKALDKLATGSGIQTAAPPPWLAGALETVVRSTTGAVVP
jgi:hypothetical protein